jgi:hypothetical protein
MQKFSSFCLQKPKDYLEFHKYVRNIIDWGIDRRARVIRDSLGSLMEEGRQRASQAAKFSSDESSFTIGKAKKRRFSST